MKIILLINTEIAKSNENFRLKSPFILLTNATIVGILTFMSRINFSLGCVEHEKGFITSMPGRIPNNCFSCDTADFILVHERKTLI